VPPPKETLVPTTPDQPTAADVLDAVTARESLREMAAVVRAIFGVNLDAATAPPAYVAESEPEQALPTPPNPAEYAGPADDVSPELQDQLPVQPAALTSVPMPTAIAVEGVTYSTPEPAPTVLSVSPVIDVPTELRAHAEAQAPEFQAPDLQGPGLPVPTEVPSAPETPSASTTQATEAPTAIQVPGLVLPEFSPSEIEDPQALHQHAEFPTAETQDDTGEPQEEPDEPGHTAVDEKPLPPEDAPRPDRRSMALLQEIAFLDD
jgi:hypothetical protein